MAENTTDPIGTIRREYHDDGNFSIWLLMHNWNENAPQWRCVYCTIPGNVGRPWPGPDTPIGEITHVLGSITGTTRTERELAERDI